MLRASDQKSKHFFINTGSVEKGKRREASHESALLNLLLLNAHAQQVLVVANLGNFGRLEKLFRDNMVAATFLSPFNQNGTIVNKFCFETGIRVLVVSPAQASLPFSNSFFNVVINFDVPYTSSNYIVSCVRAASINHIYTFVRSDKDEIINKVHARLSCFRTEFFVSNCSKL